MYTARYIKYTLRFIRPAGTSRGVLRELDTWFIFIGYRDHPGVTGIGECPVLPGLSLDDRPDFELMIRAACDMINSGESPDHPDIRKSPALRFGMETALKDIQGSGKRILFDSDFTSGGKGIPINGLIWMADKQTMLDQITQKIEAGFSVLKLKVGTMDTGDEIGILKQIRMIRGEDELEIRLDANGAWETDEALQRLDSFSRFGIHSVEQPLAPGQWANLSRLCRESAIPVALDEELIGDFTPELKNDLISETRPAFLVLKPGLLGGFSAAREWINLANHSGTGWWITSALESNIGLNAIAQWTATLDNELPQGLGTGSLYSNNIPSPLELRSDRLFHDPGRKWNMEHLNIIDL